MITNTVFPIALFTTKGSTRGEEYCIRMCPVNYLCRGVKCHKHYICTGLSSALRNESDLNLSLGFTTDHNEEGVRVIECSEYQISEECKIKITYKVFQTEWVPSHPQLLAVATNKISFYEYENQTLTLRKTFVEEEYNPVICMDWDSSQPQEMLITRRNGKVAILSMEYGTFIQLIRYMQPPDRLLKFSGCGARFGTGDMKHCIFLVDNDVDDCNNRIKVFDRRFSDLGNNSPWHNGNYLSLECSKHSDYLIASLTSKNVHLHDLRNFRKYAASFHNFEDEEYATCICWSPYAPELYIGTSTGAVLKWRINDDTVERYFNQKKKIARIHCPEANRDLLFYTCYESFRDRYPNTIEVYSMQSFINSAS